MVIMSQNVLKSVYFHCYHEIVISIYSKGFAYVFVFIGVLYFGITVFILFCVLFICLSSLLDKVKIVLIKTFKKIILCLPLLA